MTIDGKWDLIIAHPPCTFLSNVSTRHFSLRCTAAEKVVHRWEERAKACVFFMLCALADCDRIAVENPVGFISKAYRKPDQIIHPYMFSSDPTGEEYVTKRTCLWLKGLPSLKRTNNFPKPNNAEIFGVNPSGKTKTWVDSFSFCGKRQEKRSKTFQGIAKAMAEQWGVTA